MFSLWRYSCLQATITTFRPISRATHSKDGPVSLWTLRVLQSQFTIQQRHKSQLVRKVRHEGFRTNNGILVKPGDTVELEDGNFLRVKEVLHNEFFDRYFIVGWKFVRNKETLGLSAKYANEVYWVVHLAKNNTRPAAEQALVKVDGSQILRKRTMNMVNTIPSDHSKATGADLGLFPDDGVLSCRWKHVILTNTGKCDRPLNAFEIRAFEVEEASFQRLRAEECDDRHNNCTIDEELRRSWLGAEEREGADIESKEPRSLLVAVETLSLDDDSQDERVPAAYTFADVCCGAGGASRGAEMAGFQLCWALDHNAAACETFRLNFPKVQLYHKSLKDVVHMEREGLKVDILHISPPCQAFSPANTTPNLANDTINIAANMKIGSCLDIAKPKIATLEQTSGLMSCGYADGKHSEHWGKLIEQFTSRGYSVAWKNMDLAELGLPQPRKRLIMIASCPGEPLPHFPQSTHTRHPTSTALKSFTSVKDAISNIPPNWPDHSPPPPLKIPRAATNENAPLSKIITTNRSRNAHPSGLRTLSVRELACLQGFPLEHRFAKAGRTMTQIGNAFPPTVAAVLYKCIKRQLLLRDGYGP